MGVVMSVVAQSTVSKIVAAGCDLHFLRLGYEHAS